MVEIEDSHISSGLNELEKTFQEYKSKLEHAEQEAQQILNFAWKKAETIIKDKQSEAQKMADETRQAAETEAEKVMAVAKVKAAEIEKEADNKAKKEAKDRTKREIERLTVEAKQIAEKEAMEITDRAKREAEEMIREIKEFNQLKFVEESNTIIADAEQKARKIREDSVIRMNETGRLIDEVSLKAVDILRHYQTLLQSELGDLTIRIDKAEDNMDMRSILVKNEADANNDKGNVSGNFRGQRKLVVLPPYTGMQTKKLTELLKRIPGIKIDGTTATEENFSISLSIVEPIPLKSILSELSLVESSDIKGDIINLKLKPSKIGSSEY